MTSLASLGWAHKMHNYHVGKRAMFFLQENITTVCVIIRSGEEKVMCKPQVSWGEQQWQLWLEKYISVIYWYEMIISWYGWILDFDFTQKAKKQ